MTSGLNEEKSRILRNTSVMSEFEELHIEVWNSEKNVWETLIIYHAGKRSRVRVFTDKTVVSAELPFGSLKASEIINSLPVMTAGIMASAPFPQTKSSEIDNLYETHMRPDIAGCI